MKQTRPENGLIKLYLYERGDEVSESKIDIKRSWNEINSNPRINGEKNKSMMKEGKEEKKKCCCCFWYIIF